MNNPKQEARDPNTTPTRLAELIKGHPEAVLENPALPLILLENPGWLQKLEPVLLLKLLQRPKLPLILVETLAEHPKNPVKVNVQMHVILGEEVTTWQPVLQNLGALSCPYEHWLYLEKHNLLPEWLKPYVPPCKPPVAQAPKQETKQVEANPAQMTEQEKAELRAASFQGLQWIAQSKSTPSDKLAFLAETADENIRYLVATNPATPLEVLEKLKEERRSSEGLSSNPAVSAEFLADLLDRHDFTGDQHVANSIAANKNCTPELATRVRELGASLLSLYRFLSDEELSALFQENKYRYVAEELLARENAPVELVADAVMMQSDGHRTLLSWFCALLHTTDQDKLTNAFRSTNWYNRFAIVLREDTKAKTLEKLAGDANRYIRAIAKSRLNDSNWSFAKEHGL